MVEETEERGIFFARGQPRSNQRPLAVQINDAHVRPATGQEVAVAALERRAGDHAARAELPATVNPCRNLLEPGPLLAIVEWMGRVQLGDVRRRMELATFFEWQAQSLGKCCCDRRLPASRDACDNEDRAKLGDARLACRWRGRCPRCRFSGLFRHRTRLLLLHEGRQIAVEQIADLGKLNVRWRILGQNFWIKCIVALFGKYRGNPPLPFYLKYSFC